MEQNTVNITLRMSDVTYCKYQPTKRNDSSLCVFPPETKLKQPPFLSMLTQIHFYQNKQTKKKKQAVFSLLFYPHQLSNQLLNLRQHSMHKQTTLMQTQIHNFFTNLRGNCETTPFACCILFFFLTCDEKALDLCDTQQRNRVWECKQSTQGQNETTAYFTICLNALD